MKIVSVNVSLPVKVEYNGEQVTTGFFKKPVSGSVLVRKTNLAGDGQADLTVHGGEDKAVYAYSHDHYEYWQRTLSRDPMPPGQFGENLTVSGLDETTSCIGDHWQIGSAQFAITQPRMPCFKLAMKFDDVHMPRRFTKSGLSGVYLSVQREGMLASGDEIKLLKRGTAEVSVMELLRAHTNPALSESKAVYRRVLQVKELAAEWREKIASRLERSS